MTGIMIQLPSENNKQQLEEDRQQEVPMECRYLKR
jgi:hypothetical protein